MAENCIKSVFIKLWVAQELVLVLFVCFFFPCILKSRKLFLMLLAQFLQQNGQIFKDSVSLNHV